MITYIDGLNSIYDFLMYDKLNNYNSSESLRAAKGKNITDRVFSLLKGKSSEKGGGGQEQDSQQETKQIKKSIEKEETAETFDNSLSFLKTLEKIYPDWADKNLKEGQKTIDIKEDVINIGDLSINRFPETTYLNSGEVIEKNNNFFYTKNGAKELEGNGYRLLSMEDINYCTNFMPGNLQKEKLHNFFKLLSLPLNGFKNIYGPFVGYNKIGLYRLSDNEQAIRIMNFFEDNIKFDDVNIGSYLSVILVRDLNKENKT